MAGMRGRPWPPLSERFWSRVDKSDVDGCWLWTGALADGRYGVVKFDHRRLATHRVSWEMAYGPIPKGMNVCHRCDNTRCVRPSHLFLGTHTDNANDRHAKKRDAKGDRHGSRTHPNALPRGDAHWQRRMPEKAARGERVGNAKLTAEQVREIRTLRAGGRTLQSLADQFGVRVGNISAIVARQTWKHID
jgi:hypothetical protein